jgi:hypothetical protein
LNFLYFLQQTATSETRRYPKRTLGDVSPDSISEGKLLIGRIDAFLYCACVGPLKKNSLACLFLALVEPVHPSKMHSSELQTVGGVRVASASTLLGTGKSDILRRREDALVCLISN